MNLFGKIFTVAVVLISFCNVNATWRKVESGTLAWLHSIRFLNSNKGFIGGSQGTFLVTEDGGKTWKQAAKFTEDTIRDIYFTDEKNGWLVCERDVFSLGKSSPSYFLKTTDGGTKWERIELPNERGRISKILFDKKNNGYAFGEIGVFYVLQDDGKTWKKSALPVTYRIISGVFPADFTGYLVGGGGTVLFTEDAGLSWNKASLSNQLTTKLNSVFFINRKTGWTVGAAGKIYYSFNGGKFWREQTSGVTKDLNDVFFINTAEGFAVGDDGIILHSTTAGNIWERDEAKINHRLEKVVFVGNRGFAVGFGGTIITYEKSQEKKSLPQPTLQKRNFRLSHLTKKTYLSTL